MITDSLTLGPSMHRGPPGSYNARNAYSGMRDSSCRGRSLDCSNRECSVDQVFPPCSERSVPRYIGDLQAVRTMLLRSNVAL